MDDLISKLRSQSTQRNKKEETVEDHSEIPNSQSESDVLGRFRLDFDVLKKNRINDFIMIEDVLKSSEFRIEKELWAIVKSVETYKGVSIPVYKWELCDETGIIYGSSLVGDTIVRVGNIVCLKDFALWKSEENNHLNIVERNLKKTIK